MYIASFANSNLNIHPFCKAQIALLIKNKAFTAILLNYANFADIISSDLTAKLLKYIEINNNPISLVNS